MLHQAKVAHLQRTPGSEAEVAWAAAAASEEAIVAMEVAWEQILVGLELG